MRRVFDSAIKSAAQNLVVIYARYSTDMQNPQSCADQVRVVREQLSRRGIDHDNAQVIVDEGISGTRTDRPGYVEVLKLIDEGRVLILAVDELSRLTRGHDAMQVIQNVNFRQGRFLAFGENIDSAVSGWEMMAAFKQVSNNAAIEETARRVRRGKAGAVLAGYSAGDFPFGYESVFVDANALQIFERGQKPKKKIRIKESEVPIVREAFELYAKGESFNRIASDFSRRKLLRGNRVGDTNWSHQQICRILTNPKYTGKWIYGKSTTLRNSKGKKRQVSTNPSEHIVVDRPELRIIDEALFEKVQSRIQINKKTFGNRFGQQKRGPKVHHTSVYPSSMLGGIVHCRCGAAMHHIGHEKLRYFACPIAKRRDGRCNMHTHVPSEFAKRSVLDVVLNELRSQPEFHEEIFKAMTDHLERTFAQIPRELERIRASIADSIRVTNKLMLLIEKDNSNEVGVILDRIKELSTKIKMLEQERTDAESRQSALSRFPTLEWFQSQLIDTHKLFESESRESSILLRKLIGRITAEPVLAVGKKRGFIRLRFEFNRFAAFVNALEQSENGHSFTDLANSKSLEGPGLKSFTIDLGKTTKVDDWGPKIVQMRDSGMKWKEIVAISGMSQGNLCNYYQRYKKGLESVPQDASVSLPGPHAIDNHNREGEVDPPLSNKPG